MTEVSELWDSRDPEFVLSVASKPSGSELMEELETNTDGKDHDDDPAFSAEDICALQLEHNLDAYSTVLDDGDFAYTGDKDFTDNDAEGEDDREHTEPYGPGLDNTVYRHTSAMSSSSSVASAAESVNSDDESEQDIPSDNRRRASGFVPAELIGKLFVLDD